MHWDGAARSSDEASVVEVEQRGSVGLFSGRHGKAVVGSRVPSLAWWKVTAIAKRRQVVA